MHVKFENKNLSLILFWYFYHLCLKAFNEI